jgi:hypothetical protein
MSASSAREENLLGAIRAAGLANARRGCVCPPTAERTCRSTTCGRGGPGPAPVAEVARPRSEWHEDLGDVLWWVFDSDGNPMEAPWVGTPLVLGHPVALHAGQGALKDPVLFRGHIGGWPGYHTHWTPLPPAPVKP